MDDPEQHDQPVESGGLEDAEEDEEAEGAGDYDTPQSPNKGRLPTTGSETGGFSGAQVTDFRPGRAEPTPLADDGEEADDERD